MSREASGGEASGDGLQRVVVTSPRTRAAAAPRRWPVVAELDEQTELGAVYVRSLMRIQFRLAVATSAVAGLILAGLPLLLACAPGLARIRWLCLPLPWLILGVGVPPVWVALAYRHVRRAERADRDFTDLVRRS